MTGNNVETENQRKNTTAEDVIALIVDKALKKYKIDRQRATDIVMENMRKHHKFLQLLENESSLKKILKSRAFDEVNHSSKHQIYYSLRQYNKDEETRNKLVASLQQVAPGAPETEYRGILDELVKTHISTKERLNSSREFYRLLFQHIGEPVSILDVGCGMHPLLFPFDGKGKNVRQYTALDKDPLCISALKAYAPLTEREELSVLTAMEWNIRDDWRVVKKQIGTARYDVAFFLKVIPVVSRIERPLLAILEKTPADTWVISGSRTSMTKYVNIEGRERRFIHEFLKGTGKTVVNEFATEDEFIAIARDRHSPRTGENNAVREDGGFS
jgi:hypothetical protein